MNTNQLWQTVLSEIELQISRPNFLTWLKNSQLCDKKDTGEVIIGLSNNFAKEWVENKYHKIIFEILKNNDDSIKKIEYVVMDQKNITTIQNNTSQQPQFSEGQLTFPEFKIDSETGVSLKAAGWECEAEFTGGGKWRHTDGKPRRTDQPMNPKQRWAKKLNPNGIVPQYNDIGDKFDAQMGLFQEVAIPS